MAVVLRIDPRDSTGALLLPQLAQRLQLFSTEYDRVFDPRVPVANYMSRLWADDPGLLILGLVEGDTGAIVGHVVAEKTGPLVNILQLRADQNVGDALTEAVTKAIEWGKSLGCTDVMVHTTGNGRDWEKRLPGLKRYRQLWHLPLAK
jgi:hypothetical protein